MAFLDQMTDGLSKDLEAQGISYVDKWVAETLEEHKKEFTDVAVAKAAPKGLPPQVQEAVQKSYEEVRKLIGALEPKAMGWEEKVRDTKLCGLQKAIHKASGSVEWVEPKWKREYERQGAAMLGMSAEERRDAATEPEERI